LLASLGKRGGAARTLLVWMDAEQYRGARCVNRNTAAGKIFKSLFSPFLTEPRQIIGKCRKGEIL